VLTATLAAIGAAGIPSAGLVTMVIVVEAVNDSIGGDKRLPLAAVGIILGIDRILDMCRTMVNVWGDCVGAKIITRVVPDCMPWNDSLLNPLCQPYSTVFCRTICPQAQLTLCASVV
jgi:Na+/H+-dicarboxylate symporter